MELGFAVVTDSVTEAVASADSGSRASLRVIEVPLTREELEELVSDVTDNGNNSVSGYADFPGRFIVRDGSDLTPDAHDDCTHGTGGWHEGGRTIYIRNVNAHQDLSDGCWDGGAPYYTTGFAASRGSYQGILTAGHCIDDLATDYRITESYAGATELFVSPRTHSSFMNGGDQGFVREVYGSGEPHGRIYRDEETGWLNLTHVQDYVPQAGWTRCLKSAAIDDVGRNPGTVDHSGALGCGLVTTGSYAYSGGLFVLVENGSWGNWPSGGSSGGPWYVGSAASGLHSASGWDEAVYWPLSRARNAWPDLQIYCGGTAATQCPWSS